MRHALNQSSFCNLVSYALLSFDVLPLTERHVNDGMVI